MVHIIGEFGAAVAEDEEEVAGVEPRGFVLVGEVFYVSDDLSFVPYGKYCQAALTGRSTEEAEGAAAIMDMMKDIVAQDPGKPEADDDGPARAPATKDQEWARFCDHATLHHVKMVHMLEIIRAVMTGDAGRPTPPPADSPSGRSKTGTSAKSNGKSSRSGDPRKRTDAKATIKKLGHDFEPVTGDVIAGLGG